MRAVPASSSACGVARIRSTASIEVPSSPPPHAAKGRVHTARTKRGRRITSRYGHHPHGADGHSCLLREQAGGEGAGLAGGGEVGGVFLGGAAHGRHVEALRGEQGGGVRWVDLDDLV